MIPPMDCALFIPHIYSFHFIDKYREYGLAAWIDGLLQFDFLVCVAHKRSISHIKIVVNPMHFCHVCDDADSTNFCTFAYSAGDTLNTFGSPLILSVSNPKRLLHFF
jgi:hypothetical protein